MRRWLGVFSFLSVMLLGVTACGDDSVDNGTKVQPHAGHDGLPDRPKNGKSSSKPAGYFSFQPDFVPITFNIGTDGHFSVDVSADIVTPMGRIGFSRNIAQTSDNHKDLPEQPFDVTQLIICQSGTDRQSCLGYTIDTGRKIHLALNGTFQQTVERNRITIDATPGSTITVDDAGGAAKVGPHPAARIDIEEFNFAAQSADTTVDLERDSSGSMPDLSYDHVTGELKPMNGAVVSRIRQYAGVHHSCCFRADGMPKMDLPGENDCVQTKPGSWQQTFGPNDLKADLILACVETAESDFGYVVIGRDRSTKPVSYYLYSYTWVR